MANEIVSYTIIRTPPEGFEGAPYCVAIINTGSKRLTARITGYKDGQHIQVGDKVIELEQPDAFGATYRFAS